MTVLVGVKSLAGTVFTVDTSSGARCPATFAVTPCMCIAHGSVPPKHLAWVASSNHHCFLLFKLVPNDHHGKRSVVAR